MQEAKDRWANLEVNYLLQRVESYTGVVILTTNLRDALTQYSAQGGNVVTEYDGLTPLATALERLG